MLNEISRRTQIPVEELNEEIKKPTDSKDYKALLKEVTQSKIPQAFSSGKYEFEEQSRNTPFLTVPSAILKGTKNDKTLRKKSETAADVTNFHACCSPDCDWLLDYLEIDKTVVMYLAAFSLLD
ncbi:hypothetical protein AC249_AIPGENE4778 [Exaiptasia diaphana]|nr:hypothetical protein AC249_AIPGENE4778 [Exaiptasia diaphana]